MSIVNEDFRGFHLLGTQDVVCSNSSFYCTELPKGGPHALEYCTSFPAGSDSAPETLQEKIFPKLFVGFRKAGFS